MMNSADKTSLAVTVVKIALSPAGPVREIVEQQVQEPDRIASFRLSHQRSSCSRGKPRRRYHRSRHAALHVSLALALRGSWFAGSGGSRSIAQSGSAPGVIGPYLQSRNSLADPFNKGL